MFSEKDFSNLQFNPLTKKKILDTYPKLIEIVSNEWVKEPDIDNILRYVILVYDPKSTLVITEKDLNYRKGIGAELAGLNTEDEEYIQSIYSFSNPAVLDIACRYLVRFARSKEWAAICAFEYKFWESIRKTMQPIKDGTNKEELDAVQKKAAISDEIDKDIKRLEAYYKTFFGEDADLELKAKSRVTPESIAKLK